MGGSGDKPTLLCLPYAGGSSIAYQKWGPLLADICDLRAVDLPGRGRRATQACLTSVPEVIDDIIAQHEEVFLTGNFHLFGHSFGALLSYELSLRLAEIGYPEPLGLYMSAANPPHRLVLRQRHKQSDADFLAHLTSLGGLPDTLMDQPEALRFFMRVLRADFMALENHGWDVKGAVDCPLNVIYSEDDNMSETGALAEWQRCTTRTPAFMSVSAQGHMYLDSAQDMILTLIRQTMQPAYA